MKYNELNVETKKLFLEWVCEGLLRYTRDQVVQHTQYSYIQALKNREKINTETIWNRLNEPAVKHVEHVQGFVDQVKLEIKNLEKTDDFSDYRSEDLDVDQVKSTIEKIVSEDEIKPIKKTKKTKKG